MIKSFSYALTLVFRVNTTYKYVACMPIMRFYRKKAYTFIGITECRIIWKFLNIFYILIESFFISEPFW